MPALKAPVMLTFVGDVQSGKTRQALNIFNAKDDDGRHPFRPCLFITSEGAARVTAAALIDHPQVVHVEATTPEELTSALEQVFPRGLNGEPFALVIFDGWSSLQERTKADERANATNPKVAEDNRVLAARTAPRLRTAIAAWQNASSREEAKGCVFVSTCHVVEEWRQRPGSKDINDRLRMGLKMDVSGTVYNGLHRDSNAIVYLTTVLPDITDAIGGDSMEEFDQNLDDLNKAAIAGELSAAPMYIAITRRCKFNGDELKFIKHQDGLFQPDHVKIAWRAPDFGEALRTSPLRK